MKKDNGFLLFLAMAGMELSWLDAWANFLTVSILNRPFPLPEAIGTFALATAITLFSKGKGWRVIYILGIQVFGFLLAALRFVYIFNSWSSSFLSQLWVKEFFSTPRGPLEWFNFILVLFCALLFWIGGATLARRSMAYSKICSRFDLGLAAFFLLFLIKFLLLVKGEIKVDDPMSSLLVFPFFVFSLLAIGMVRNRTAASRDFLPGYQGIGVTLSFTVVVFLFCAGLVLFFMPYLTLAAEVGHGILKTATKPLGPILVSVLRFIFMHGVNRPEPSSPPIKEPVVEIVSPAEHSWWMDLLEKILGWVFGGLLGLIVLIVAGVALFLLFRWLLSRTPTRQRRQSIWFSVVLWVDRFRLFLFSFWKWIRYRAKHDERGGRLYEALLSWGRRSGLPHFLSETPSEYGLRLKDRFPALKEEISLIVEAFNQETYGDILLNEIQLSITQSAWHRLRSPLLWPLRLKTWFLQSPHLPKAIQDRSLD
jgi:hypothetical protein